MQMLRRPALFKRFPKFRTSPSTEEIVPRAKRGGYPAFREDFEILDEKLLPTFQMLDTEALKSQNRYRWMYVILIFGGAIATIVGIFQLAFITVSWLDIIEAVAAALLGFTTAWLQAQNDQERYLTARLAAERLRSQYFLFLARCGDYANEQDRVHKLIQNVLDIKEKGE